MRILNRIAIAAVTALFLAAALTPAQAACGAPNLITTIDAGGTSFVWNGGVFTPNYYAGYPGYAPAMYPGNPPVTPAFSGVYWSVGTGDPAFGAGDDNGTFTVDNWFSYYALPSYLYYESGTVDGTWAQSSVIDGCILNAGAGGSTCTCVLLTDQDGVTGYYALIANATTAAQDTFLRQPGNDGNGNGGPVVMQPVPKPTIVGSSWNVGTGDTTLTVNVSGDPGNYNLNPGTCPCGPGTYKVMQQTVARGATPPDTRDLAAWSEATLPGGGTQPETGTPLGADVTIETACGGADSDVYLTTMLMFDSGFNANVVSTNSTRVECGPNIAEPIKPTRPRQVPSAPRDLRAPRRSR